MPVSQDNQLNRLVSFLTAKSDPGQLREARVVRDARGPARSSGRSRSTARSTGRPRSRRPFTLLDQQGSRVIQGSMQLIPVGNSIIYVRPDLRRRATGERGFPQFQFVVVFYRKARARCCAATVSDGARASCLGTDGCRTTPTARRLTRPRRRRRTRRPRASPARRRPPRRRRLPPRPGARQRPAARRSRTSSTRRRRQLDQADRGAAQHRLTSSQYQHARHRPGDQAPGQAGATGSAARSAYGRR